MDEGGWNRAIFDAFFGEAWAHRSVYLCLDDETLVEIGETNGIRGEDAVADFERAIQAVARHRSDPFVWWRAKVSEWTRSGCPSPPPFVGLLSATVLAASRRVSGPSGGKPNYYVEMSNILGIAVWNHHWYRAFIPDLWARLASWLELDQRGELGLPTAQAPTRFDSKIGFATSQALLSGNDRERLGLFFLAAGFEPGAVFEAAELVARLREWSHSGGNVSPKLLRMFDDDELRDLAGGIVASELQAWDGTVRTREGYRVLQLVLALDMKYGVLGVALKLPTQNPPLDVIVDHHQYTVDPDIPFLRLPIEPTDGLLRDGTRLADRKMRFAYQERLVIPFAANDDIGGWSSVERTELDVTHCVLIHQSVLGSAQQLMKELGGEPRTTKKVPLPPDWSLFKSYCPTASVGRAAPELMPLVPGASELPKLRGGLRVVSRQSVYLVGGAPDLVVPGVASHDLDVDIEGRRVGIVGGEGRVFPLEDCGLRAGPVSIAVGSHKMPLELLQHRVELPQRDPLLGHHILKRGSMFHATGPAIRVDDDSTIGCALVISGAAIDIIDDGDRIRDPNPPVMIKAQARRYLGFGQPGQLAELHVKQPAWAHAVGLSFNSFEVEDHETEHQFSFLFVARMFTDWAEIVSVRSEPILTDTPLAADRVSEWANAVTEIATSAKVKFKDEATAQRWAAYSDQALKALEDA